MGTGCSKGLSAPWSSSYPLKILILGKQSSGKTFLLYSWRYGVDAIMSVEPTKHFNVDTVTTVSDRRILVYDLAGNIGYRLRPFLDGTEGIVYMIYVAEPGDSIFKEEEESIKQLIQERDLESTPFLFVIRGHPEGLKGVSQDLTDRLQATLEGKQWDIMCVRDYSQEDADLVLQVLEKMLSRRT
ncbi:ADP-ribosylation factor [Elysia marginata]|uniref:ADP-ribosylation factor n=1 Tax=Elysia marginata TaxID=1093978 RepID=A0AAV4GBH1_9GAST|nr:ADP-ribosylation factor [Elysia marginata]